MAEIAPERGWRERESRFERQMTDAEALMWNVEKDPWLNPNGASVSILDRPIDFDDFRHRMANAVAKVSRLRERVVARVGRLTPPVWLTDPDFDLDYHVRHAALPAPGTRRQLFDLASLTHEEPFDRTRPLWWFLVVDGLEGGQSALIWKVHHSISDGTGLVHLSEQFMQLGPDDPPPPEVDLDQVIADAVAADHAKGLHTEESAGFMHNAAGALGHLVRRQAGVARRATGEAALWYADPLRIRDAAERVVSTVRSTAAEIDVDSKPEAGSPLWVERSRRRHLETLRIPLSAAKEAGKALGGSVNDVFVTGAAEGAAEYHRSRGSRVQSFRCTFVVSTRTDDAVGGNSFTPVRVTVPGGPMPVAERFEAISELMAAKRRGVSGPGALAGMAGVANLLPTSVVTRLARSQASKIDFATSNLRAAPFEVWVSGAKTLETYPLGPVAGTAFNLTTVSYNGSLDMGLCVDPAAVADPVGLRDALEGGYEALFDAAGVDPADHR